jgi:hypothetical protein
VLFYYLGHRSSTNLFTNDDSSKAVVVRALGYTGISLDSSTLSYTPPSLDEIAAGFWHGVSYNIAGLGLLLRLNNTLYAAAQSGQTSVYVQRKEVRYSCICFTGDTATPATVHHDAQFQTDFLGQLRQLHHCEADDG